jgi:hypothetical protein
MSRKPGDTPGGRESRRLDFYVTAFIVAPMLGVLAFLLLLPLFTIFAAGALLGDFLGFVLSISIVVFLNLGLVFQLVCSLLAGDWGQFIRRLPELLEWLRSLGLL